MLEIGSPGKAERGPGCQCLDGALSLPGLALSPPELVLSSSGLVLNPSGLALSHSDQIRGSPRVKLPGRVVLKGQHRRSNSPRS